MCVGDDLQDIVTVAIRGANAVLVLVEGVAGGGPVISHSSTIVLGGLCVVECFRRMSEPQANSLQNTAAGALQLERLKSPGQAPSNRVLTEWLAEGYPRCICDFSAGGVVALWR